jgi:hypothetical protein
MRKYATKLHNYTTLLQVWAVYPKKMFELRAGPAVWGIAEKLNGFFSSEE